MFVSPSVDGGNATGDQIGPSAFQIPDTDTKLYFSATGTTQSRLLKNLLNATLKFIRDQLAASGDGELPKHLDPFTYDLEQGIFFQASSQEGRHLTYVFPPAKHPFPAYFRDTRSGLSVIDSTSDVL